MQAPPPPPPPIVDCAVILSGQKLICHKPCSSIKMRSRHHHFPRVYCPSITRDLKPLDVLRDTQSSVKSHLSWLHWTHLLFHTVLKNPIKRPVKKTTLSMIWIHLWHRGDLNTPQLLRCQKQVLPHLRNVHLSLKGHTTMPAEHKVCETSWPYKGHGL